MDRALRAVVRARALGRCEYCGLQQATVPLVTFHVDHVMPRKHGGGDRDDNLALACFHCNLHKGPNLTGIDPDTGAVALLFHPRREVWDEHFFVRDAMIMGRTPTGRATVRVLDMNAPTRIELRLELMNC